MNRVYAGEVVSAAAFNTILDRLDQLEQKTWTANKRDGYFYAQITAFATVATTGNYFAHSWKEIQWDGSSFDDVPVGRTGSHIGDSAEPAFNINGGKFKVGTKVILHPGGFNNSWTFQICECFSAP